MKMKPTLLNEKEYCECKNVFCILKFKEGYTHFVTQTVFP